MTFVPFAMERWQSVWENQVRYNLSESGVHPLTVAELLELSGDKAPLDVRLGYPQSNGTEALRVSIASLYPGATPDHVLVTSGSSEANYINCWKLIEPGDRVAIVVPTYMQTVGLGKNFGAEVRPIALREDLGWQPDPSDIDAAIQPGTKLVVVTHPNNPTGAVLSRESIDHLVARAERVGAWLLADEVFQGAERSGTTTPSLWGRTDRLIAVSGLSKAYGLPGLRIGWSVAPPDHTRALWERKDYTSIATTTLSNELATLTLRPDVRPKILERTRTIIRTNWALFERGLADLQPRISWRAPDAGAIVWVRYQGGANSTKFAETLRASHDVLIVPGDQFGMDGYLRFGFGLPPGDLATAVDRVAQAFRRGIE